MPEKNIIKKIIKNATDKNCLYLVLIASKTFRIISNKVNIGNNCNENKKCVSSLKIPRTPNSRVHINGSISVFTIDTNINFI